MRLSTRISALAACALAIAGHPAGATPPSAAAERVLQWVARTHDNGALPYAVIDKTGAALFLFDAAGRPLGQAPVLIGAAPGDESAPGVGNKPLAELGPAEKTTPAGRYLARFGYAAGGKTVLWIDYADAVALHPVVTTNRQERRVQRLASPAADDNRITFGCVNVPAGFYSQAVQPAFLAQGGVVYVLPDTKPLEEVFPALSAEPLL